MHQGRLMRHGLCQSHSSHSAARSRGTCYSAPTWVADSRSTCLRPAALRKAFSQNRSADFNSVLHRLCVTRWNFITPVLSRSNRRRRYNVRTVSLTLTKDQSTAYMYLQAIRYTEHCSYGGDVTRLLVEHFSSRPSPPCDVKPSSFRVTRRAWAFEMHVFSLAVALMPHWPRSRGRLARIFRG